MKPDFPITPYLDSVCRELERSESRCIVLTAEPGAGKSTVLPLGLLENFKGKILMTQPRRLAVLGVADRLSFLLGEECGNTCGYRIRLESRTTERTRLEIVTEAVLVRILQQDPALEQYNVVVLDEFHERSVNIDLALAFLKEALELRDDLYVIVMSATIDTEKTAAYLGRNGSPAPVIKIPGRTFPVEIEYAPSVTAGQAVLREIGLSGGGGRKGCSGGAGSYGGSILVFLPGISEIRKCCDFLRSQLPADRGIEILMLHSSVSMEEQKKVLEPPDGAVRRVVVSSAIAETSVTVPGVTCVIDCGLSRINRTDVSTGMQSLVTQTESEFSAVQRAGRAGRQAPGKCVRLWNKSDVRIKELPPEIKRCDITELVLECAERGVYSMDSIDFLDSPGISAWNESVFLLKKTGCLKADGHISGFGRKALRLGLNPRLASIVLCAAGSPVLLSYAEELVLKYGGWSQSADGVRKKVVADLERRLKNQPFFEENGTCAGTEPDRHTLILCGFADRLARRISVPGSTETEYQFASGRKAVLHSSVRTSPEWIVAPEVSFVGQNVVVFAFEEVCGAVFEKWLLDNAEKKIECSFDGERIRKTEMLCYGEIVLAEKKLLSSAEDFAAAWAGEIKRRGFCALPTDERTEQFLRRVKFFEQQGGVLSGNKECSLEERLSSSAEEWLVPFLVGIKKLESRTVYDALYWYLDGKKIDGNVPSEIVLENGRKCRVQYEKNEKIRPVIQIIIQRIFGCMKTPEILGMKVLFKLLSPASRPLQITDNLENFWQNTWPEICREMKGLYPKHNWNYRLCVQENGAEN